LFVSVVLSFHDEKRYIQKCLRSLFELDYPKDLYEIIVVADGCDIEGMEIIKKIVSSPPVKTILLTQEDKGPAAGRNLGIKASRGEVIAITDPDCIVDEGWLKNHVKHYNDPKVGGVEGKVETEWDELCFPKKIAPVGYRYATCNMSYRRKALEEVRFFDEDFRFKEDDDLAYRVIEKGWRIVEESAALVYHPVRNLDLKNLIKRALKSKYDVLLYKKHPELATKTLHVKKIGSIAFTPESKYSTIMLMVFIALLLSLMLNFFIITLGIIIILTILYVYLSKKLLKRRPPLSVFWMLIDIFFIEVSRIYGSIKYRKFLL